jgi:nucleoside-diphosphate-sugar epimerase
MRLPIASPEFPKRHHSPSMKLLLVGHGFLGHAIARVFRENGWDITATTLSGSDGTLSCDVGNPADVARLLQADFIVHCAASGRGGAEAYQRVYVDGCRNLAEKFPNTPLLFTSSSSVYAQTDGSIVRENSPTEPDRDTGRLLLEAENVVLTANGLVVRLSGIYGPGRSVIIRKFLNGESVIEENGRRFLNQIHRDDAATAILHLANQPIRGEIFNVSDSTPLTQLECHQKLAKMFSRPLPPLGPRDLNRKRGWTHKQVSNEKLRKTGWHPKFPSFLDAISDIVPDDTSSH